MNEEASPSGPSTSRTLRVDAGVVRVYERGDDDARAIVTEVFTAALADAEVAETFVREARALASLSHPRVPKAVVTVLGEGKIADAARVSQPLPPGPSSSTRRRPEAVASRRSISRRSSATP